MMRLLHHERLHNRKQDMAADPTGAAKADESGQEPLYLIVTHVRWRPATTRLADLNHLKV